MRAIASPFVPTYRGAHLRSALQATWDKFGFVAPRRSSVVLSKGAGTFSFTRATTATVEDWEGAIRVCKSGEVRFPGARRVENLIPAPSASIAIGANKTVTVTPGTYVFSMGAEATGTCLITFTGTATGSTGTLTANATNRTAKTLTITAGGTIIATCTVAAAADVQLEDVTGQSNQNPAEHVSVGVLSSPFHGAMVDGVKYFEHQNGNTVASNVVTEATGATLTTCKGQLDETASTNLVLQSSNFGASWTAIGTPTRSAAARYCGSVALDLIGNDADYEGYRIALAFTGNAQKSLSFLVSKGTAASTSIQLHDATASTYRISATITWSGDIPVLTCTTGSQERPPEALANGVYRVFFLSASVVAANTNNLYFYPTYAVGATGNIYIGGVQAENATTASSHIPTTTGAVTRNADAGSYPSAGNVSASGGTLYLEYEIERETGADQVLAEIGDGSSNERISFYRGAAGGLTVYVADGGVAQCALQLGAAAVGSSGRIAVRWAANDFAGVMTGGAIQTDASGTLPTVTAIFPGNGRGTAYQAQGPTKNLRISQQLLSNAELLALVA